MTGNFAAVISLCRLTCFVYQIITTYDTSCLVNAAGKVHGTKTESNRYSINNSGESSVDQPAVADWDLFSSEGVVPYNESKRLILGFPITQYWDVHKKSFRTGIIGDMIKESNPDLISDVQRKFKIHGKPQSIDTTSVELPLIFMHSFNAIKFVIELHDFVARKIADNHLLLDEVSSRLEVLKTEMKLAMEKDTTCKTLLNRINTSNFKTQAKRESTLFQFDDLKFQSEQRKMNLIQSHEVLSNDTMSHLVVLRNISIEKQASLREMQEDEESRQRISKIEMNQKEHQIEIDQLKSSMNIAIDAIVFKSEEQSRLDRANADVTERINAAEADSSKKRMTAIIDMIFQESTTFASYMFENPSVVLWWGRTAVLFFMALITVYEITSSL